MSQLNSATKSSRRFPFFRSARPENKKAPLQPSKEKKSQDSSVSLEGLTHDIQKFQKRVENIPHSQIGSAATSIVLPVISAIPTIVSAVRFKRAKTPEKRIEKSFDALKSGSGAVTSSQMTQIQEQFQDIQSQVKSARHLNYGTLVDHVLWPLTIGIPATVMSAIGHNKTDESRDSLKKLHRLVKGKAQAEADSTDTHRRPMKE